MTGRRLLAAVAAMLVLCSCSDGSTPPLWDMVEAAERFHASLADEVSDTLGEPESTERSFSGRLCQGLDGRAVDEALEISTSWLVEGYDRRLFMELIDATSLVASFDPAMPTTSHRGFDDGQLWGMYESDFYRSSVHMPGEDFAVFSVRLSTWTRCGDPDTVADLDRD